MKRYFNSAELHNEDAYVVDYSESTKQERGVEIFCHKPEDIESFHLSNPNGHEYWSVNFEKHKAFFRGESNCECMFATIRNDHRKGRIALFVELKYGFEKNIDRNVNEALGQLINTQRIIRECGCIDGQYKVFLNVSSPKYTHREPFTAFLLPQNDIKLKQDENDVIILGLNEVIILTPKNIKLPREEV
ncbi:MAG: hypothetical protein J1E38_08770 [Paramuribaculum sp.]|nr:hypothetical protein [Paramuribaculum sp.]